MSPESVTTAVPSVSIRWHRRLEARVLFFVSLIAGVSLAAVLVATERIVTANSVRQAVQDLETAREAFHELVERRAEFAATLGHLGERPALRPLGGARYVSGVYPLLPNSDLHSPGRLILLRDWQPTQQFLDQIQGGLLWVGGITLTLALCLSWISSRRVTRPMREIAEVAKQVAAGSWTHVVSARGTTEALTLATAFNDMMASLSHWHAQADARTEQLEVAYQRFLSVTDNANDSIISTDAEGRIIFWNRRAQSMFGYAEREVLGKPLEFVIPDREAARRNDPGLQRARCGHDLQGVLPPCRAYRCRARGPVAPRSHD